MSDTPPGVPSGGARVRRKSISQTTDVKISEQGPLGMKLVDAAQGRGVVIQHIKPDGLASQTTLRVGDSVQSIGGTPVTGVDQCAELLANTPRPFVIGVRRETLQDVPLAAEEEAAAPPAAPASPGVQAPLTQNMETAGEFPSVQQAQPTVGVVTAADGFTSQETVRGFLAMSDENPQAILDFLREHPIKFPMTPQAKANLSCHKNFMACLLTSMGVGSFCIGPLVLGPCWMACQNTDELADDLHVKLNHEAVTMHSVFYAQRCLRAEVQVAKHYAPLGGLDESRVMYPTCTNSCYENRLLLKVSALQVGGNDYLADAESVAEAIRKAIRAFAATH